MILLSFVPGPRLSSRSSSGRGKPVHHNADISVVTPSTGPRAGQYVLDCSPRRTSQNDADRSAHFPPALQSVSGLPQEQSAGLAICETAGLGCAKGDGGLACRETAVEKEKRGTHALYVLLDFASGEAAVPRGVRSDLFCSQQYVPRRRQRTTCIQSVVAGRLSKDSGRRRKCVDRIRQGYEPGEVPTSAQQIIRS